MSEHKPGRTAADSACPRSAGGPPHPVSLRSLMTILRAQRSPYLPSSLKIVRIPARGSVLRIEYPAPSPLGLLGSGN
jgi:hypothetical protein